MSSLSETTDFEQWMRLASQDPEGFELMRLDMIEELISSASSHCQKRLRGLQWRIDQVRGLSANPMAACIALSGMMWETFAGEDGLVQTLNRGCDGEVNAPQESVVIAFPDGGG